jgi:3-oxoacyl-[acyl-carrier protein] reductase
MMLGLAGKSLVVGSASRGPGRATAEQLVTEGARVLLAARGADAILAPASSVSDIPPPKINAPPTSAKTVSRASFAKG